MPGLLLTSLFVCLFICLFCFSLRCPSVSCVEEQEVTKMVKPQKMYLNLNPFIINCLVCGFKLWTLHTDFHNQSFHVCHTCLLSSVMTNLYVQSKF